MAEAPTKTIRMGMVGIGVGGAEILPAMASAPGIELYAGADINSVTRERFQEKYPEAKVFDSIEALCADPDVDAVWISTPNRFHAPHTIYALEHGKHVVVEKPMALSIQEAEAMCEAAEKNNRILTAGHTDSYSFHIRAMRRIVNSGRIGALSSLQAIAFTDWIVRPRSAEEQDPAQGAGVVWRQTPHQVDSMRLIGGGLVRSVRGTTKADVKYRPFSTFYSAYLEFEDGTPAYIFHDGKGYFFTGELLNGQQNSRYTWEQRRELRRAMNEGLRDDEADKQALRIGGENAGNQFGPTNGAARAPRYMGNPDAGIVLVSAERGALRASPNGVFVYDEDGQHDVDLSVNTKGPHAGRQGELVEFHKAIMEGKPPFHDGRWGMATLEVALAIMASAKERKEIMLSHQIAVPDSYDADLVVPYLETETVGARS
jgi:phthalate 4,5-cis-dihydrodiol dehydrogenase